MGAPPGRGVPRRACVAVMRWGREEGGVRATRGLRPVGGWWGEAGGMLDVRHRFARSRTRLASVRCFVASACRHVRRAGTLVLWLVRPSVRYLHLRWSPGGQVRRWRWRFCPSRGSPRFLRGVHRGLFALWLGIDAGGVAALPASCAASRAWPSGTGIGPQWPPTWPASAHVASAPSAEAGQAASVPPLGCRIPACSSRPGSFTREVSAGTVARVASGSGSGPGLGAGRLLDGVSVGCTACPAGGSWCCWDTGSACAGDSGWHPGANVLGVAGAWGLGLSVGLWASGRTVPGGPALVASVGVLVHVCVGGPLDGACVGPSVARIRGPCCGRRSGWACVAAAWLAAGWRPRADVSGGVWGCGAGSPVGPRPGLVCGCTVPRGCSGRVPAAAVFLGLGTVPLPARDARCSRIAVAAWCCGWCRCAARLDARSCPGLCGMPAPDGAGTPVVSGASVACGRCGELTVAWEVEVDGPEAAEAVGLCGAPTPDGARARTFVAWVAAVPRDRGGGGGGDGRVSPAGGGGAVVPGTSGHHPGHRRIAVRARLRRCDVRLLGALRQWHEAAGEGHPPPREIGGHQPLGRPLAQGPAAVEEVPPFVAMGAAHDPHGPFHVPHQPAGGEPEASGVGDHGGAPVLEVHGADGAPTVWEIAQGG